MYFLKSNNFYLKHFFLTSIFIKIIFKKMKIFEFFENLTLKMTLSAIIIIIFIISTPKYSNILIDNKIGGLSLSELHPSFRPNEKMSIRCLSSFVEKTT